MRFLIKFSDLSWSGVRSTPIHVTQTAKLLTTQQCSQMRLNHIPIFCIRPRFDMVIQSLLDSLLTLGVLSLISGAHRNGNGNKRQGNRNRDSGLNFNPNDRLEDRTVDMVLSWTQHQQGLAVIDMRRVLRLNTITALMMSIDWMMFGVVQVMVTPKEGALLVVIPPNT